MMLIQLDVAIELDAKLQRRDFQGYIRRKRFVAGNDAVGDSLRHGLLYFALRVDTDHFQEFANADVKLKFFPKKPKFSQ